MRMSLRSSVIGLFIALNMSPIFWYDLRILNQRSIVSFNFTEQFFMLWAALMLPFVAYFVLKTAREQYRSPFYIAFVVYILNSLIVGGILGNDTVYLLSDTFKAFVFLSGFGLYSETRDQPGMVFRLVARFGLAFMVIRFLIFLFYVKGDVARLYYGTVYDVIFFLCAMRDLHMNQGTGSERASRIRLIAGTILSLIGQKRTVLLSVIIVYLLRLNLKRFVISSVVVGAAAIYLGQVFLDSRYGAYFSAVNQVGDLELRRLTEARDSIAVWLRSTASTIFGSGFGLEIYTYAGVRDGYREIHSIHNTFSVTLARSGLFGLAIYVSMLLIAAFKFLDPRTRDDAIGVLAIGVFSIAIYTFMDEMFVGYFMARMLAPRIDRMRAA